MSISQAETRHAPAATPNLRLWEIPVAALLSLICPGLGWVALGVPPQISTWKLASSLVSLAGTIFIFLPMMLGWNVLFWLLLPAMWLVSGLTSAIKVLRSAPQVREHAASRRPRFLPALGIVVYLALGLLYFAWSQRAMDLALETAPPGSWLAPTGTYLISVKTDIIDRFARGQLVEYSSTAGPKLGRVLALGGDWFAVTDRGFVVNGNRYSGPKGVTLSLVYSQFVDTLSDYSRANDEIALPDFTAAQPRRVEWGTLVVTSDDALTSAAAPLPVEVIHEEDIRSVPLARMDSLTGGRYELAQPEPRLYRAFSRP